MRNRAADKRIQPSLSPGRHSSPLACPGGVLRDAHSNGGKQTRCGRSSDTGRALGPGVDAKVGEDGANGVGIRHLGEETPRSSASSASEDILDEHPLEQLRPGHPSPRDPPAHRAVPTDPPLGVGAWDHVTPPAGCGRLASPKRCRARPSGTCAASAHVVSRFQLAVIPSAQICRCSDAARPGRRGWSACGSPMGNPVWKSDGDHEAHEFT